MGLIFCFIPLLVGLVVFLFGFKMNFLHLLIASLLGFVAVVPISFIQYFLPKTDFLDFYPLLKSLLTSLILYGFIEEFFKMILILPLPHKNYSARNFLLLCFAMGLSLACFESAVYFFEHLQRASARGAQLIYSQIFARIFSSDIIHMTCTGLCGLFIYSCRQKSSRISIFVLAVLIHGIYDFFAGFQNNLHYFSIAVILLAIAECRIKYQTVAQPSDNS